jgi:tetratricopeptide (TPR) repeat protein
VSNERASFVPDTEYRYWAFISYSSKDKSWARWLQRSIESYGIPARLVDHPTPVGDPAPRRLKPLFRDRSELPAAADLGTQIEAALAASRYLIVVCSPQAAQSRWVDKEIATFRAMDRPGRVLAVVVEGEPGAGDERECFPPALRDTEPLAADARPEGDGKRDARLKLLAGMLGVGFDALKQRDTHRRIRRLQATIAAVLALAVGFAGLTAYAVAQRNTARTQRDKAVKARQQSETVLEYLLFDLRDLLEPIGKLDIMEDVQKQVDRYYRQLGVEKDNPLTSWNRSVAFNNKGKRLLAQGDVDGALRQFEAGLKIMQSLTASRPGNVRWQRDLAVSEQLTGRALEAQGDLPGAQRHYQTALTIRQRLSASDPDREDLQRELGTAHADVGDALRSQGDYEGALGHYNAALDIARYLVSTDGKNSLWLDDLATSHNKLARLFEEQGDLSGALRQYRDALAVDERVAASDPRNATWQQNVASSHNDVGAVLIAQGDPDGARRQYRAALQINRRLATWDPSNADWQRGLAVALRNLSFALYATGDLDGALLKCRRAVMIDEHLAATDAGGASAGQDLTVDNEVLAAVLEAQGLELEKRSDLDGALAKYREAVGIARTLVSADPGNEELKATLTKLRDHAGRVRKALRAS